MTWFVIAAVVTVLVAALRYFGSKPVIYRNVSAADLPRFAIDFLVQMAPGSQLHVDRDQKPGFLQFVVTKIDGDERNVEFGFPDITWSGSHFDAVASSLAAADFEVLVEPGQGQVARFLRLLLSGPRADVAKKMVEVMNTVSQAMEWPPEGRFRVRMLGALRTDPGSFRELMQ